VDAAVVIGKKAYMFRGDKYVRYDVAADRQDEGYPQAISAHWRGVFADGVDEAVRIKDKIYFFKGDAYVRYDIAADRADDGYPKKIAADWPGLPAQIRTAFMGSKRGDDPEKILYVLEAPK
jgi:matrix metalloproteinase-14 (membrane-inserted)